jgi:hypothetical protein
MNNGREWQIQVSDCMDLDELLHLEPTLTVCSWSAASAIAGAKPMETRVLSRPLDLGLLPPCAALIASIASLVAGLMLLLVLALVLALVLVLEPGLLLPLLPFFNCLNLSSSVTSCGCRKSMLPKPVFLQMRLIM